jgi:hypothetical protein
VPSCGNLPAKSSAATGKSFAPEPKEPKDIKQPAAEAAVPAASAASSASSVEIDQAFEAMGCRPFGPPEFQQGWARAWSQAASGQSDPVWSEVMEAAICRCSDLGVKVPGKFILHKREVEKLEVKARYRRTPL